MEENLRGCVGGSRLYRGWVSMDEGVVGGINYWAFVVASINVVYVFCKYIKSIMGFDMKTRPPARFHQLLHTCHLSVGHNPSRHRLSSIKSIHMIKPNRPRIRRLGNIPLVEDEGSCYYMFDVNDL